MMKSITRFLFLTLACSFLLFGFLKTDAAAAQAEETLYTTTDVNVRTGPGTKYDKIGVLLYGHSIVCTGTENGWSKVLFNGSEGYVRSRYLSPAQPDSTRQEGSDLLSSFHEGSVDFDEVEQTVYATTDVNVRIGPGTEYDLLGYCSAGETIYRTGISSNGWSRVIFKEETAYIRTKYLSSSQPAPLVSVDAELKESVGRLTIPSVDIDVELYYCSSGAEYADLQQSIVDDIDSAVYLDLVNIEGTIIADHKHHGFSAIGSCVADETRAFIDYGTHVQEFICIAVGPGTNTGNNLLDWNGNSLNYGSILGGLAMYTCNESWKDIIVTYWMPI